ncbi:metal ABC transporter solute-binding protein, Zn/Mn family [Actinomyces culturomici]|uniref:metal ABC transporter solute-binding protein, Zn/Mn family n=1 Tax=Actinomyces culturomici TaxID=1926276 RepID=UPI000E202C89|nr:metal ABC transporter substrate-binding protein [Actinomyces culturomici]
MTISRPLALATALLAAGSLAACSTGSATSSTSSQSGATTSSTLKVEAAFYPLKYLTEQIGGDLVDVESLTPDGAEPHDLELSPAAVDTLSKADAVVYLKGFQGAVDDAVEQAAPKTVVDVSTAVQLVDATESGNHAGEEEDADEAESGHDHDAEEGHHHDMTADPHFWLDPERMGMAATAIGQALATADPDNAQTYTANAASVTKAMKDLGAELVDGTATCEHKTFVTAHTAFGYLADRTGLTQVGISGLDPESSPSPARLQEISKLVKAEGVSTIFTEALIDPKVAETLANDLGIQTAVLDPIESQVDPQKDYSAVMRDNITALQKALTCK